MLPFKILQIKKIAISSAVKDEDVLLTGYALVFFVVVFFFSTKKVQKKKNSFREIDNGTVFDQLSKLTTLIRIV